MRAAGILGCILSLFALTACGGSQEHPALAPTSNDSAIGEHDVPAPDNPKPAEEATPTNASDSAATAAAPNKSSADVPTPKFKENGSVLDAINAVPQGTPRVNIDQEDLGRPLNNPDLYEPCKPGSAHFKAKVAVWDGKAVGLDLTTTPKNAKFAACIAERIRSIAWPDKVKSLNTVEYTF
jgi:hypothetical protein